MALDAGEAGVGKTALIERLARDLPEARWYWGGCDGLFTPRPLAPLYDLADQPGGPLADLCGAGAEREALFRAPLRQVSEAGALTVVVVEDVHWPDEATIGLLRFAAACCKPPTRQPTRKAAKPGGAARRGNETGGTSGRPGWAGRYGPRYTQAGSRR